MSTQDSDGFDAVVGLDQATLNATVAQFYGTFPGLFSQTFQVNQENITTVSVDFQTAPTVALTPPAKFHEEARAFAAGLIAEEQMEDAIRELTAGSMTASCSTVAVTVNSSAPAVNVTASVSCGAAINVQQNSQGQNVLVISLSSATITVDPQQDPQGILSQLLNALLVPQLLTYLNTSVLGPIQIPVLALEGVTFVPPSITDETTAGGNEVLVAYTGMNQVVLPQPGFEWPAGNIFIGIDADALNAVANGALPQPSDQGGTDDPINLSWGYNVQLSAALALQPGSGNSISGTLGVNANANFTWHTPNGLPNISFGASISGTVDATAALVATPDGSNQDIQVTIEKIGNPNLSVDFSGIVVLLEPFLGPISTLIVNAIVATLGTALQGFTFTAYSIPPITMSFAGFSGQLMLQNIQLNTIAGPGGVPLAAVTATATFATTTKTAAVAESTTITSRRRPLLEKSVGVAAD